MLKVTNEEFAAITAGRKMRALKVSDSQYAAWFTVQDQRVIDAGDMALESAKTRHNAWHNAWMNASESDRPAIEAACAAAESKMKTIKL